MNEESQNNFKIAIIGLSCRFPQIQNIDDFWENLVCGKETICRFSDEELELDVADSNLKAQGIKFNNARGVLENVDLFDADFFEINPNQASTMDPQHRLFLECSWEAIESAGYDPFNYKGSIGTFAGSSINSYLHANLFKNRDIIEQFCGNYQNIVSELTSGNDKDYLPLRVAHKLNLRGPAYCVQSACSTSLVAVCQAAQSLLNYQCDMALAGGVSITFPQKRNYIYQEGAMVSGDGRIRVFDAKSQGTVFGHGVGVVLLKRLNEAIADGDSIEAVISGFAVNNDGSDKIGFAAPSIKGQEEVISMALDMAGIHPEEISYIEAHGTGTPLGDPVEIAALTQAFKARGSERKGYCAIGSCKPNIGHLDVASGIAGLIKTVLSLHYKKIPPTINYEKPNPEIDFTNSPFYPLSHLKNWESDGKTRFAGVSSFGVGGTNAHVILEEAPAKNLEAPFRSEQLIVLSAKTEKALESQIKNLGKYLEKNRKINLADVSYTLQEGRKHFKLRHFLVSSCLNETLDKLNKAYLSEVVTTGAQTDTTVCFLFPGQGAQKINMGKGLYESEEVFRSAMDHCANILKNYMDFDLIEKLYSSEDTDKISDTVIAQPALFSIEYALAKLWMSWGIKPGLLIGHSVGEYVASVISGVFTLEVALCLLARRANQMQSLSKGGMMVVHLSTSELEAQLPKEISIAAENAPELTVISGSLETLHRLEDKFIEKKVTADYLVTSHAFHSSMMDPILEEFETNCKELKPKSPNIPWISTNTGRWITDKDLRDPSYWSHQLRHRVKFSSAMECLGTTGVKILLEVGPGKTLSVLSQQQNFQSGFISIPSLPEPSNWRGDIRCLLDAVGQLWSLGISFDWKVFHNNQLRNKVKLPTYPFERKRFWVDPPKYSNVGVINAPCISKGEKMVMTTSYTSKNGRNEFLVDQLKTIISKISGNVAAQIDNSIPFVEQGFDSLLLTQLSVAIQKHFGIKIPFRQMMREFSSIESLIAYIDKQLPDDLNSVQVFKDIMGSMQEQSADISKMSENDLKVNSNEIANVTFDGLIEQSNKMVRLLELFRHQCSGQLERPNSFQSDIIRLNDKTRPKQPNKKVTYYGSFKINKQNESIGELKSIQRQALKELISKYENKTIGSKKYTDENRSHFADPRVASGFNQAWKEIVYPIVVNRSYGSKLYDIDGNVYIDITMGFGANFFGHSPDWITEELHKQLDKGVEIGPQSHIAGDVAKLLCELTGFDRATFCNTGSETVMASLRIARAATDREKVVMFDGSYHGNFDEILVRPTVFGNELKMVPIASGVNSSLLQNIIILDFGTDESLAFIQENAKSLAAVLVEPVQSRNPNLRPREFLHKVREITKESGTALIFDEVITGFRAHLGGAQAYYGIKADICTYGKIIGGGMPLGAIAGTRFWMDHLDGGKWQFGDDSTPEVGVTFFAGTFVRHPLAMASAYKVLKFLKEQGPSLQEKLNQRVALLTQRLNKYLISKKVPLRIVSFSSFFVIEYPPELSYMSLLWYYLREKGIHVWEGFPCFISLAHSDSDLDKIAAAFEEAVFQMQVAGFIPKISEIVASTDKQNCIITNKVIKKIPVNNAQQEIWLGAIFSREASSAFNESTTIYFNGHLKLKEINRAVQSLIDRHEAFRITFDQDGAFMYIHPEVKLEIPVHDLRSLNHKKKNSELKRLLDFEGKRNFDLIKGPLLAVQLILLSEQESAMLFTAHHIILDGWSQEVVFRELSSLYSSYVDNKAVDLGDAVQISEFVDWERNMRSSLEYKDHEKFWLSRFVTLPPYIEFPFTNPRPDIRSFNGDREIHTLGVDLVRSLSEMASSSGLSLFNILLAGYQILLSRITELTDFVIGIPYAAQNSMMAKNLVGHCVNLLPLRTNVKRNMSTKEFLQMSYNEFAEVFDHKDYSFGALIQKLDIPYDPARIFLISVIFNLDVPSKNISFSNIEHKIELNPRNYFHFELAFNAKLNNEQIVIECDYNTKLFENKSIKYLLRMYELVLIKIIEFPDISIKQLHDELDLNSKSDDIFYRELDNTEFNW